MMLLGNSAVALILYTGGRFVLDGSMSIGAMTTFLLYVIFVAGSLGILSSVYGVASCTCTIHYS